MAKGLCVVVTGSSGTGKTSVVKKLLEAIPGSARLVTTTSREPRPGEEDGVDYNFVDRDHFIHMTEQGELIEWEENYGNLYGSERVKLEEMLDKHSVVFVTLDIRGAKTYREKFPEAVSVAIFVPADQIQARLLGRGAIDSVELERRIEAVREEQDEIGVFDFVVENVDGMLEEATVPHAKQFVLDALEAHRGEQKKNEDVAE